MIYLYVMIRNIEPDNLPVDRNDHMTLSDFRLCKTLDQSNFSDLSKDYWIWNKFWDFARRCYLVQHHWAKAVTKRTFTLEKEQKIMPWKKTHCS